MERLAQIKKLSEKDKVWDIVVVGGGATGLGVAVDAATRGLSVALLEKTDFAKCTSSRSTKLVHGGVRYLQKGDVMLGGEESGGIGIPSHVMERDGLLMALLLCETMAQRGMSLGQLVDDMFQKVGKLEFERQGLKITDEQMANFRVEIVPNYAPAEICGKQVVDVDRRDGVKFYLEGDAWVMMRPSGTEPLVRIYAEAETVDEVHDLLKAAESVVVS